MSRPTESAITAAIRRLTPRIGAGALTMLALPPWGWWPLAPIGLAWLLVQCDGLARRDRIGVVWWFWFGAYLVGLIWMIDLTVPGWLVAVPVEATIMAVPVVMVPTDARRRLAALPGALVLGEAVRWVVPFGGVPMANIALGQVNAPWLGVARVGGTLLVIALVGVAAVGLWALAHHLPTAAGAGGVIVVLLVLMWVSPRATVVDRIDGAVVQAGGQLGTNAETNVDEAPTFERHVDAMALLDEDVDLVVWSESSATSDGPLDESPQADRLRDLADDIDAVVVANFSERTPTRFRNAAVAVEPGDGIVSRYDKVHLVPFGEYVPLRSLIDRFADLSLIPREAIAGSGPAVLRSRIGPLATVISFEVYFTARSRSGIGEGATVILNPTLASSYTTTMVPEQTLAAARLRSVEADRWTLQASTTGYTAIVDNDGDVVVRTGLREQRVLTAPVELREGQTWAMSAGKWPVTILAIVALAAAVVVPGAGREPLPRGGRVRSRAGS